MFPRRHAVSLALLLAACAAHDDGAKPGSVAEVVTPEVVTPKVVTPEPRVEVAAAVASVQLIQDCPDPDGEGTPTAVGAESAEPDRAAVGAESAEPDRAVAKSMPGPPRPGARAKRAGGGWRQPCTQSTMQLALRNDGQREAILRVEAVRLIEAASGGALGAVAFRRPSQWSPRGVYQAWDERVPVAAELKVSYRLGEPDWGQVQAVLGPADLYTTRFVLEVDVRIDGARQTLRSPEFVRERVHMMAT